MTKFEEIWKEAAEKSDLKYNEKGTLSWVVFLKEELKSRIEPIIPQQALPVVPECAAELIEWAKKNGLSLKQIFVYDRYSDFHDADEWLGTNKEGGKGNKEHQDIFALAFITGKYEVEKPQLFYIELPNVYGLSDSVFVSKVENGTILEFTKGKDYALAFTEQEIKSIDERYWQFAVPVEDGE